MPRTLIQQILHLRCPKCGQGRLLKGMLGFQDVCSTCGLSFKFHDSGDGPAFFAIMIVGFIVMGGAGVVEYHLAPPMWLHAAIWLPLTFVLCITILRVFKAGLILLEFRTGRLKQSEENHNA